MSSDSYLNLENKEVLPDDRAARLFELADVILAVGRHLEAEKAPGHKGNSTHGAVLRHVDRHPGATVGDVAESSDMLSNNVSRAIRGLVDAGYIRRDVDEHDARKVRLFPTEKAKQNLNSLKDRWSRLLDRVDLDDEQVEVVIGVLRHVELRLLNSARSDAAKQ